LGLQEAPGALIPLHEGAEVASPTHDPPKLVVAGPAGVLEVAAARGGDPHGEPLHVIVVAEAPNPLKPKARRLPQRRSGVKALRAVKGQVG